jgi:hypothetical protein
MVMMTGGSPIAAATPIDGQLAALGIMPGGVPSQPALQGVLLPQQVLDPETQATSAFLQSAASCVIPKLSNYVGSNVGPFPQLSQTIPLITRAAEFYGQRDFARALAQVYQAYRLVAILRAQQPGLPDPAI